MFGVFGVSVLLALGSLCEGVEFFVAPDGNDAWNGLSPSRSGSDGPFLTVFRAQRAAREAGSATVSVRQGLYFLNETLWLEGGDSGCVWRKYPGDAGPAVLSGGVEASFSSIGGGMAQWEMPEGVSRVTQLFFGGNGYSVRALRSRVPSRSGSDGYSRFLASSVLHWDATLAPCSGSKCPAVNKWGFVFGKGDLNASWSQPEAMDVLQFQAWVGNWAPVRAIEPQNDTLLFAAPMLEPVGQFEEYGGKRYVVENVREALVGGGAEFYSDDAQKKVIWAVEEDTKGVLPVLDTVVGFRGVQGLAMQGLSVAHASDGGDLRYSAYFSPTSAISIQNSSFVSLSGVTVRNVGGSGIAVLSNTHHLNITHCLVRDTGGDGIQAAAPDATHLLISDTIVNDTAKIFLNQPAGIRVKGAEDIRIQHNQVAFSPYGGILVGWQPARPTPPPNQPIPFIFNVSKNKVLHFGLGILSDFGGIYVSSDNNTCFGDDMCGINVLVESNVVEQGMHYSYGSNGWYSDEQASGIEVRGNLFTTVGNVGLYHHCGNRQIITNNFVYNTGLQKGGGAFAGCNAGGNPTWPHLNTGFNLTSNILFSPSAPLFIGHDYRNTSFQRNLYFTSNHENFLVFPNGTSWTQWHSNKHRDQGSSIQDPLFADPTSGNFTLLPLSPALKMGITQLDIQDAGPRSLQ